MPDVNGAVGTGGGGGIGRTTTFALAPAGARLIVADVRADLARRPRRRPRNMCGPTVALRSRPSVDVSRWYEMERLRNEALGAVGRVDIVIANADISEIADFPVDNTERRGPAVRPGGLVDGERQDCVDQRGPSRLYDRRRLGRRGRNDCVLGRRRRCR